MGSFSNAVNNALGNAQPDQQPQAGPFTSAVTNAATAPQPQPTVGDTQSLTVPVGNTGRFYRVVPQSTDLPAYERFLQGVKDPLDAGAQLLTRLLPEGAVNAVNSATQWVNNQPIIGPITKDLGMVPATNQQINDQVTQSNQQYDEARKAAGGGGFDFYRLMGNVAANAPLAYVAPAAATLPGAIASGAVVGAAGGAMTPVTNADKNNFWQEKANQVGLGALVGGASGAATKGLEKLINPTVNPKVKLLMSNGVTPTPGQILGGSAATLEDKATSIPLFGDMIKSGQRRGMEDFDRAIYNNVLQPIGEKYTGDIGREGIQGVEDIINNGYQKLLPKMSFQADQQFVDDVNNLKSMATMLPDQQANQFDKVLTQTVGKRLSDTGYMDGETLKGLESELTTLSNGYRGDSSFDNRQLGKAIGALRQSIRDTLSRSNPQYADELSNLNNSWARLVILQKAAGSLGADNGIFTAAQLQSAVKASDQSARKSAFSKGTALMQDLSDAGKNVLGSKYPDSGTAGRAAIGLLLSGGLGYASPAALGAAGVGSLAYTPFGQRLLAGILAGERPTAARTISAGLSKAAPAIGAATVQGLLGRSFGG